MVSVMSAANAIVLFDGECAFCDRSVRWIMNRDRAGRVRFAPRQSPAGQRLLAEHGLPPEGIESMILIEGSRVSTHSTAVLRIGRLLPFPWNLGATLALVVPRFVRDLGYKAIAKRRYKLAGKCSVPTAEQRERILDKV
jgi:predicted DCC family thiol-disulfide oxidoreductase YuxK